MMTIDTDHLSISELRHHLDTETVGRHIYLFGRVASTNETLRRLAARGAAEGTVVLGETETPAGGRAGDGTCSPQGVNVYVNNGGNDMFVKMVAANATEHLPVPGVSTGAVVTLKATRVDGSKTYTKTGVSMSGMTPWQVP